MKVAEKPNGHAEPTNGRAEPRNYFTVLEAAARLHVSPYWVYKRIGKKDGPPVQYFGGRYRFPRDKFIAWAEQDTIR